MVREYATTYIGKDLMEKQKSHEVKLKIFTLDHLGYCLNHLLSYNSASKFMFLNFKVLN